MNHITDENQGKMARTRNEILTAPKAPPIVIHADNIPDSLKHLPRWVCWKWVWKDGKWTKLPIQPDGSAASTTDPSTWYDWNTAWNAAKSKDYGVGFVFNGDGLVGIDLDNCRSPSTGAVAGWAQDILDTCRTYAEVSPSGTGIKMFVRGELPEWLPRKKFPRPDGTGEVEIYGDKRFFTVTGRAIDTGCSSVATGKNGLSDICRTVNSWLPQKPQTHPVADLPPERTADRHKLMERARRYLANCPPAIQGNGGDLHTFKVAQHPVRGFLLTEEETFDVMQDWNGRCEPPWEAADLRRKIHEAAHAGTNVQPGEDLQDHRPGLTPSNGKRNGLQEFVEKSARSDSVDPASEITIDSIPVDDDAPMPRPMGHATFRGLAGEFVRLISPYTESSREALLLHFFLYFAAMAGRFRYFLVDGAMHFPALFVVFVGKSAKARKGTANANVEAFFRLVDGVQGTFLDANVVSGLSTGEGLIHRVRDATVNDEELTDPGVTDKRLLVIEPEFAQPLKTGKREGNTLSPVIRNLWDSGRVRTLTRNSPLVATGAHVCIGGHIVREELRRAMSGSDQYNGFANRFLWCPTERSKLLPHGGRAPQGLFSGLVGSVQAALEFARQPGPMKRTPAADALWEKLYARLATDRPGVVGAICNRAEAQILRLSMIYALLECSDVIDVPHLEAAVEVWRYCEDGAEYAFGSSTGDKTADAIRAMLRTAGDQGLTRTEISVGFSRNKSAEEIRQALGLLRRMGLAHFRAEKGTSRRTTERWFAGGTYEFYESNELATQVSETTTTCGFVPGDEPPKPDEFNPAGESSSGSCSSCNSLVRTPDELTPGYVERMPEEDEPDLPYDPVLLGDF